MSSMELVRESEIRAADPHPRRRMRVLDTEISFVDVGVGQPIVFLHGNPTSSYLWRNIIPYVAKLGRCLAPDLVGMGRSGKPPANTYRFVDHSRYLDAWFEALGLTGEIILVLHDWGSALGFHRAVRYSTHIKGIAYMEAIPCTRRWEDFGNAAAVFHALRSSKGESLIFHQNFFIETVLPRAVIRRLSDEEMAAYRAPFRDCAARLPTLVWPRQIPIDGEPADVAAIVDNYSAWVSKSAIPKLLVLGDPGAIVTGRTRDFCRSWPNQREVTVKGVHILQEDSPHEIGVALRDFVKEIHADTLGSR
jgi:haloalkane dehalogenase